MDAKAFLAQGRSLGRRRETSQLTEVHRPRARQAVDVVGTPVFDPKPTLAIMTFDAVF